MIETALLIPLALPVLWRVAHVAEQLKRARFGKSWRFQGFAVGYGILGGVTLQLVVNALRGMPPDWSDVGFVAASALLIVFDRRRE